MDRLEELLAVAEDTKARMAECSSDQNFTILGRLLVDVMKQVDELGGGTKAEPKETGLSDFEKRLRDRESSAKVPRRSKSG